MWCPFPADRTAVSTCVRLWNLSRPITPNPIRVTDIADYVCINRSYLYTLFRKELHMSPQEYLSNYRLTRASELLIVTDLSVESVAFSCGYSDPLVFSKAFKAKTGQTPSRYRSRP